MKKLLLPVLVTVAVCLLTGLKAVPVCAQTSAEEYFVAGVEFFEGKNYTAAATAFEKAVEIKPDYEDARFNLAVTYWTQKQYQKAAATLEELIQRNPESEVGKQAAQELEKLKKSGIFAKEEEEKVEAEVSPTATRNLEDSIADLRYGITSRRKEAALNLSNIAKSKPSAEVMDQIVDELVRAAFNNQDKLAVRETAVESLSLIFHPRALSAVDRAISGSAFPIKSRFKFLVALKQQGTSEAYRIILKYWVVKEWPLDPEVFPMDIMRKEWPPELGDSIMEQMNKLLGKDEMLAILMSAWPGGVETTYRTVPEGMRDYVAYYALMVGQLGGREAATLLVQRLKEDYPLVQQAGVASSIVRPGMDPYAPGPGGVPAYPPGYVPPEGPGTEAAPAVVSEAVLKEEIRFRVEAVKVLSIIAGDNLLPFLQYLAKNDIKPEVRTMASSILGTVETRIAASRDDLRQAGSALAANRLDEALRLYKQAYEKNPSPRVTREYEKSQMIIGALYLAGGRKEQAEPLLKPLFDELEVKVYQKPPEGLVTVEQRQLIAAAIAEKKKKVLDDLSAKLSGRGLNQNEIQRADLNRLFNYGIEKGWLIEESTLMEMPPVPPEGLMPGMPGYVPPTP